MKRYSKVSIDIDIDDIICPITQEIIKKPVVLVETGHTYEKSAIETWLSIKDTCPVTNKKLRNKALVTNYMLKTIIDKNIGLLQIIEEENNQSEQTALLHSLNATGQMFSDPIDNGPDNAASYENSSGKPCFLATLLTSLFCFTISCLLLVALSLEILSIAIASNFNISILPLIFNVPFYTDNKWYENVTSLTAWCMAAFAVAGLVCTSLCCLAFCCDNKCRCRNDHSAVHIPTALGHQFQ